MADQDMLHTTEIMKAALPYIDTGSKGIAELFVKVFDMMASMRALRSPNNNLAACGFTAGKIDIEGLLNGIKPVCNNREREMIDRILNFFNMKRMFEMYNSMMETMKTMQDLGGFSFGDSESSDDTENVTGNFGSSNFQSIFDMFKNTNTTASTSGNTDDTPDTTADTAFQFTVENEAEKQEDTVKEKTSSTNSFGGKSNDMMFQMLKTMVPPEQMTTFENLSMLLNSMSYDNTSKPDNKEQSDG